MLWALLALTSSATLFVSAIIAAHDAKAGVGGYALAVVIGALAGTCNAWAVYKGGWLVADYSQRYSWRTFACGTDVARSITPTGPPTATTGRSSGDGVTQHARQHYPSEHAGQHEGC